MQRPVKMIYPRHNAPFVSYQDVIQHLEGRGQMTCYGAFIGFAQQIKLSSAPTMRRDLSQQIYSGASLASNAQQMPQTRNPSQQAQQGFVNMATPVPSMAAYTSPSWVQEADQPGRHQTVNLQHHAMAGMGVPSESMGFSGSEYRNQSQDSWKQPMLELQLEIQQLKLEQQKSQQPMSSSGSLFAPSRTVAPHMPQPLTAQEPISIPVSTQPPAGSLFAPSRTVAPQSLTAQAPVFTPVSMQPPAPAPEPSKQAPAPVTSKNPTPSEARDVTKPTYAATLAASAAKAGQETRSAKVSKKTGPSNPQEAKGYWFQPPKTVDDGLPSVKEGEMYHQCVELWKRVVNNAKVSNREHHLLSGPPFGVPIPKGVNWNDEFSPYLDDLKDHWAAVHFSLKTCHTLRKGTLNQHYVLVSLHRDFESKTPLCARPGLIRQLWDAYLCVVDWRAAMVNSGCSIHFKAFADDWAKTRIRSQVSQGLEGLNAIEYALYSNWEANSLVAPPQKTSSLGDAIKPRFKKVQSSTKRNKVRKEASVPSDTEQYEPPKKTETASKTKVDKDASSKTKVDKEPGKPMTDEKKTSPVRPAPLGSASMAEERASLEKLFKDARKELESVEAEQFFDNLGKILSIVHAQVEDTSIPTEISGLFDEFAKAVMTIPAATHHSQITRQVVKELGDFRRTLRENMGDLQFKQTLFGSSRN